MTAGHTDLVPTSRAAPPAAPTLPEIATVLDSLGTFAAVLAADGTVLTANRTALDVLEPPSRDVTGRAFWDCAWWAADAAVRDRCRAACLRAGAGETVHCEVAVPMPGRAVTVECRFVPVRGTHGEVAQIVASAVDVTQRLRADAALREQESFLRSVLDASSDCVKSLDLAGRLEFVNASGLSQLEAECFEGLRGREWVSIWPDASRERVRAAIDAARDGRSDRFEAFCPTLRGRPRWWDVIVTPLRDAEGRLARIVAVSRDVTDRVCIGATLQAFYDVSPLLMGTVELLPDGDVAHLYDNPATARFFERAPGSTAGRSARELGVPPDTIALWRAHYDECLRLAAPVRFEYSHDRGGRSRLLQITVAPLGTLGPGGGPACCYVAEDVTEQRAAEVALRDADRRKDEFLATLAHELRNPLAPIRTAAHVLGSGALSSEQLAHTREVIQRQVAHMALLLDDLLDVARITQGKLELRRERMQLSAAVKAAIETARPLLDRKRHRLVVSMPEQLPPLDADPTRLAQVLANLLTNAAKYTDPGGCIQLSAAAEGSTVRVAVRDSGIGLTPEALASIFAMFSQVQGAMQRSEGGLGIGLALVRGIVELHGGTLTAHSDGPGTGSEFAVRLPLASPSAEGAVPEPAAAACAGTRRVLIADDNADAAETLAMLLQLDGHDVRLASDGRGALDVAREFEPDVVLLDIGMPGMNGYDTARALRGMPGGRRVVLAAVTGWGQEDDRRRAFEAGFDHHLTKPVDPDRLESLLASCASVDRSGSRGPRTAARDLGVARVDQPGGSSRSTTASHEPG